MAPITIDDFMAEQAVSVVRTSPSITDAEAACLHNALEYYGTFYAPQRMMRYEPQEREGDDESYKK